jgi:murein DD-endopeptidase MepM/ murein hydrolase activator NlpD
MTRALTAWRPLLVLALAVLIIALVLVFGGKTRPVPRIGFQDDDAPPSAAAGRERDARLHLFSAWDRARIPLATRFDPPLGTEHGGFSYNAQGFLEMNDKRGGKHLGDDLNGIGGMDTDLGDPVRAAADGLVVYSGEPSPGWGGTLVLAHRIADGSLLQSMYAHLHQIEVPVGSLVARGQRIGSVGTANGNYPAHLHFEIRACDGVDIGPGYADQAFDRLDPGATVSTHRNASAEDLSGAPLAIVLREEEQGASAREVRPAVPAPGKTNDGD